MDAATVTQTKPLKKSPNFVELDNVRIAHGMVFKLVYKEMVHQEFLNEDTEQDFLNAVAYVTELYYKSLANVQQKLASA